MKTLRSILATILLASPLALALPFTAAAADGSFSLTPASGTHAEGSTFAVEMRINTGGNAVTAAQGTVTFNSALLSATVSTTGTDLPLSIPSSSAGRVQIAGAVSGTTGYTGTNGLLGTITFTVKAGGTAAVNFVQAENAMVLTDGTTTIPTTATNASYTLTGDAPAEPPVVSQITATNIAETSAKVTWMTSTSTKGKVEYGTTTNYGSRMDESAFATNHSLTLSGLAANTTYYYRIVATDQGGTATTSPAANFKTTAATGGGTTTPPPAPTVTNTTGTSAPTVTPTSTQKPITAPVTGAGETIAIILALLAGVAGVIAYVMWQQKKRRHAQNAAPVQVQATTPEASATPPDSNQNPPTTGI